MRHAGTATYYYVQSNGTSSRTWFVEYVRVQSAGNSNRARCEDATDQAKDQEERPIWCKCAGQRGGNKKSKCWYHYDPTSVSLTKWAKEERPENVAYKVQRYRECELDFACDPKVICDGIDCAAGKGGVEDAVEYGDETDEDNEAFFRLAEH